MKRFIFLTVICATVMCVVFSYDAVFKRCVRSALRFDGVGGGTFRLPKYLSCS